MARLACLVALTSALFGCGTIITNIEGPMNWAGKPISPIYSGARFSYGGAQQSEVFYVWVIDVPLSAAADTGVLPISLLRVGYGAAQGLFPKEEEVVLRPEATVVPE